MELPSRFSQRSESIAAFLWGLMLFHASGWPGRMTLFFVDLDGSGYVTQPVEKCSRHGSCLWNGHICYMIGKTPDSLSPVCHMLGATQVCKYPHATQRPKHEEMLTQTDTPSRMCATHTHTYKPSLSHVHTPMHNIPRCLHSQHTHTHAHTFAHKHTCTSIDTAHNILTCVHAQS